MSSLIFPFHIVICILTPQSGMGTKASQKETVSTSCTF